MFGWLEDIWHAIVELPYLIVNLLIMSFNGWILALAALAELLVSLLPSFPDVPDAPAGIFGAVLWVLPLASILSVLTLFVSLWLGFLAVKAGLKWVRLL